MKLIAGALVASAVLGAPTGAGASVPSWQDRADAKQFGAPIGPMSTAVVGVLLRRADALAQLPGGRPRSPQLAERSAERDVKKPLKGDQSPTGWGVVW